MKVCPICGLTTQEWQGKDICTRCKKEVTPEEVVYVAQIVYARTCVIVREGRRYCTMTFSSDVDNAPQEARRIADLLNLAEEMRGETL
jgi:hypothetical protein